MEAFEAARAKRHRRINGLADPHVLDCPVCFELLAPPVFQCENGHIACLSCRSRIDQCHSCDLPIAIRNRAIEKVIESVKLTCNNAEYGCNETMSYYQIYDHEETCQHAPCSCPVSDCNFIGSSTQLYQHFTEKHKNRATQFQYDKYFRISLDVNEKVVALQEEKDNSVLNILHNTTEIGYPGKALSISCICSVEMSKRYKIIKRFGYDTTVTMESTTSSLQRFLDFPLRGFLLVPTAHIISNRLDLEIYIYEERFPTFL